VPVMVVIEDMMEQKMVIPVEDSGCRNAQFRVLGRGLHCLTSGRNILTCRENTGPC
jgi:hypothetical protein